MSEIEQKSAFLIISTINPVSHEREYLFMNTCPNSTNPDKIAIWGGMGDTGESLLEGLWRELKEELSENAANLLLNGRYIPAYIHDEKHIIDPTVPGRENWWDSHDHIFGLDVTPEEFECLYNTALQSQSPEVSGATILTQRQLDEGIKAGTLPVRYDYEVEALRKYQTIIGNPDPILQLAP